MLNRPARWFLLIKWRKPLCHSKDRSRQCWEVQGAGSDADSSGETIHGSVRGVLEIKDGMKRPQQLRGAKRSLLGDWVLPNGAELTQDDMTKRQLDLIRQWIIADLRAAQELARPSSGSKTNVDPLSFCFTDLKFWVDHERHELRIREEDKRLGFGADTIKLTSQGRRISQRLRISHQKLEKGMKTSPDELTEVAEWVDDAIEHLSNPKRQSMLVGVVSGREKDQRFQIRVFPFRVSEK